ncbi:MAG: AraC family ligand binding domain-containing protein, partial [Aristaeellaceae bacterium]
MIHRSEFRLGNNQVEILPMDKNAFPYICNYAEMDSYIGKNFSWHWHSALEIDYIAEGEMEFRTTDRSILARKGDAVFVNSNVMHDVRASGNMDGCITYAHIFDMHFLSGMYGSVYEQKYMLPILRSDDLPMFVIHPDGLQSLRMLENLLNMIDLARDEAFGYEFELRSELCRFWCSFFRATAHLRSAHTAKKDADVDRLKAMMDYIHAHYMDKIAVEDIAAAANISTRECSRCFQRCIRLSPVNYLISYRVRMAAQQL